MKIDVITRFKLNTCEPYVIRYPKPCFDTKSSPIITPISDRLIFILRVFTKLGMLPLKMSFANIVIFDAPNDFIRVIFDGSVLIKELYILIIVVNTAIRRAINMIDLTFAPTQIIISGPNEIFGSELSTVK